MLTCFVYRSTEKEKLAFLWGVRKRNELLSCHIYLLNRTGWYLSKDKSVYYTSINFKNQIVLGNKINQSDASFDKLIFEAKVF